MAFKAVLLLFTTLLVVTTRVSCHDDELSEAPIHPPHQHHHLKRPWHGPHNAHPPATYAHPPHEHHHENAPSHAPHDHAHPPKAHAYPPHHEHHHRVNESSHAPHDHAHPPKAQPPHYHHVPPLKSTYKCTPVCFERCKSDKGKRECERACTRCCKECSCVPPGPRGTNLEKCGKCYTEVTHHGQTYKCP